MERNQEILASVSATNPNARAEYQGLLGYWCQAEAIFIETLQPEPGAAIAKYRQKLTSGEVAVGHNSGTDALASLSLRAQLAEARQELADQEREKLALIRQLPPEGDGGLWALQSLEDYFREAGHRAALANIRAAAHNMGWCLDSMGCDQIVPTTGICPLCECNSAPHPAPKSPAPSPLEAETGPALTQESASNLARLDYWRYVAGPEKPQVDERGWAFPDNPTNPTGWNIYTGPELQYIGKQSLLCVGEIKQGVPSFFSLDEDEREIIGTYETSGLPVYEGDDYALDIEGCYLTREEADALLEDEKSSPAPPLEGKAAAADSGKEADRG